jgi:hypothetical protein
MRQGEKIGLSRAKLSIKTTIQREKMNCVFLNLHYNAETRRLNYRQLVWMNFMTLDETQRKKVAGWIAEGLKLSEIQNRLASELGVRMTYMDVRLLVDDLKLTPKDAEPPKPVVPVIAPPIADAQGRGGRTPAAAPMAENAAAPSGVAGGVSVSVDQLTRPGAVVSGKVTFSDGKGADWYIDQTGRLGLVPQQAGYRPPPTDLQQFQAELEAQLSKMGF